jgi:hypothetical protein
MTQWQRAKVTQATRSSAEARLGDLHTVQAQAILPILPILFLSSS